MKKKGFTLIELIVVIAIIGVLAAILVPTMMGYVKKSKITSANSAAKSIYTGAQSAITDMQAEDADMSGLKNATIDVGGTSAVDSAPAAGAATNVVFQYRVYTYFSDATKLDEAKIKINGNVEVEAVAVADKNGYVGTHPKQNTVDAYDGGQANSVATGLTYAAS